MTPLEALVALNMLPGIGPIRSRRLIRTFGDAGRVLEASADDLRQVRGIGPDLASLITQWPRHADPSAEIDRCRAAGIRILTESDPDYPPMLRLIGDPPVLLYCQGQLHAQDQLAVGVVGSRRCSHYGVQTSRKLSFQLATNRVTVVSGLARGIDTAAHEAALAAGGRTVAVIGSGLGRLYPPENQALADKIACGQGAVLSEYPLLTRPDKSTFPMRNRIIAACSQALLVVECPLRSGALITAHQAAEYGRPVYAVPGPIDRPGFAGGHQLIRDGATLVTDAAELLEELNLYCTLPTDPGAAAGQTEPDLDAESAHVLSELDSLGASVDQLVERCRLPASRLSSILLRLEMRGWARALPGAVYVRTGTEA